MKTISALCSVWFLVGCSSFSGQDGTGGAGGSGGTGGSGGAGTAGEGGTGAGGMQEGGSAGTGGDGGTGGVGPTSSCTPVEGLPVGGNCGSFVDVLASGTMDGSIDHPFSTVSAAIAAQPQSKSIFVCGRVESLSESIDLPPGYTLRGDIDCASGDFIWSEAKRARVLAPVGQVAVRVVGVGQTEIAGFDFASPSAVAPGTSSIAALFQAGAITLESTSFTAGNGAPGVVGSSGTKGVDGGPGVGFTGGSSACGATGGNGGSGSSPGLAGSPAPRGGQGGNAYQTPAFTCQNGGNGQAGPAGAAGASGMGLGTIGLSGFTGLAGSAGAVGNSGGGGGGAGGAGTGSTFSGTGGGAGGCGGTPGSGGGFGGGSFGILSLNATLAFDGVTITVGNGASGAAGGVGGAGGAGNVSAPPVAVDPHLCRGGFGATGGVGGAGGGGTGGHAIGLAFQGAVPNMIGLTITPIMPSQAGAGAAGASSGVPAPAQAF